jgi:hypothetical protein
MMTRGWTDEHELTSPWVLRFMYEWDRAPRWQRTALCLGATLLLLILLLK